MKGRSLVQNLLMQSVTKLKTYVKHEKSLFINILDRQQDNAIDLACTFKGRTCEGLGEDITFLLCRGDVFDA